MENNSANMHAQTMTIQNEFLKYGTLIEAHVNILDIIKTCFQCLRKTKLSKEETGGLHKSTFQEVTRQFRYAQIGL